MAREIYITVIGDGKVDKTSLLQIIAEPIEKQSSTYVTQVRAGQILSNTTLIIDELPNIELQFRSKLSAIVFVISPQKGETERDFISRAQQHYNSLREKIRNQFKCSIPVVVLTKVDYIESQVVQRLQLHLKQILEEDDAFFSFSATLCSKQYVDAIFIKTAQLAVRMRSYYVLPIKTFSEKVQGAFTGFFVETLSDVIRKNPVHVLFAEIRKEYRNNSVFAFLIAVLLNLLLMPFYALHVCLQLTYLPFRNAYYGAKTSAAEVIDRSIEQVNYRDVIAGAIVSVLMIAAALCIVFLPTGLAIILPSMVASVGLSGFSTAWLAIFASLVVFIAAASLYALGSNLYDYVTTPAQPPELSQESKPLIPTNNVAIQMAAVPSVPGKQPEHKTTDSVFQVNAQFLSTVDAASGVAPAADKSQPAVDDIKRPLHAPENP